MANYYIDKNGKVFINKKKKKQETDISPIKSTKKTILKSSNAFKNGYDLGDGIVTAASTVADVGVNAAKGILRLSEGLVDAGAYGVAGIADLFGADSFAKNVRKEAKADSTELLLGGVSKAVDKNSVMGYYGDAVAQGVGQIGGLVITGGLGASAGATTAVLGASSLGSGMSEAYQNKATDRQAFAYGLANAAVEVVSERIFNGLGKAINFGKALSSADDVVASKVGGAIRRATEKAFKSPKVSKAVGNLVEYGIKSGAEGVEEIAAGFGNAVAKKLTYESNEDLKKLVKDENLLEQFIIGSIVSGIAQGSDVITSTKRGKDFVTGYTDTEQKVIDKVTQNRIAEKKKQNGKVTAKQKSAIAEAVKRDLDKGYITTDEINEALGGDSYKEYKSYTDSQKRNETALSSKIEALEKKINSANGETDTADLRKQLSSARKQLKKMQDYSQEQAMKNKLTEEVYEIAKNSRLVESYNESARRGEKFSADLTKYTAKEQAVVQKAIDSGILNNSNRTHDFVDFVAKISAAKGIDFDFADNAKIKESGFAVDGAVVNGYVNENGITLNAESVKSLDSVVGHEITHVLEGTELYDSLKSTITEYAKSKGIYDSRLKAIQTLYEGKNADVEAELTADLVGDFIFSDADFVNHLTSNRNLFEKVFNEIKYLARIATAGSKEMKQLEKAKMLFERAYQQGIKNTVTDGVRYSLLGYTRDGRRVYETDFDADITMDERIKAFKDRISTVFNLGAVKLKTDVKKIQIMGDKFTAQKNLYGDKLGSKSEKEAKVNALYDVADILATSKYLPDKTEKEPSYSNSNISPKNAAHKDVKYWYKFQNEIIFDDVPYTVTFSIRDKGSEQYQYFIDFKENKTPDLSNTVFEKSEDLLRADRVSNHIISNSDKNVNRKNSISEKAIAPIGNYTGDTIAYKSYSFIPQGEDVISNDVANEIERSKLPIDVKRSMWSYFKEGWLDKGMVFETLSKKTGNRELEAKWHGIRLAESKAQAFMQNGAEGVKSLENIRKEVLKKGFEEDFEAYMYHLLNVDRTSLMSRFGKPNKGVFENRYTSRQSQNIADGLEIQHPEFKKLSQDIYKYMNHLRSMMVKEGIISQDTAEEWSVMYPHYIPVRRDINKDESSFTPDTNHVGVQGPKRAKGGDQNIKSMFETIAEHTAQTFSAIARNRFGIELMDTEIMAKIGSIVSKELSYGETIPVGTKVRAADRHNVGTVEAYDEKTGKYRVLFENKKGHRATKELDAKVLTPMSYVGQNDNITEIVKDIDNGTGLLREGLNGNAPTFTVFDDGKKIEFTITSEMYAALKPTHDFFKKQIKFAETANDVFRNLVTSWNPVFGVTNFTKDIQDVLLNSQHAFSTYRCIPSAIGQLVTGKGSYLAEYLANGGEGQRFYNHSTKTFNDAGGFIEKVSRFNDIIEMTPRLAEYIASREAGRSIDVSMLDAARVTTNFQAGADLTKFLNRNGATFLNASVQGLVQNGRNVREAFVKGPKGVVILITKLAAAGIPALVFNNLFWDDDEDYQELADYIKDGYYIIWKYGDGKFVRLPKGRTLAVIQNAFTQLSDTVIGDGELDWQRFYELFMNNIAPNNPMESNLVAPVIQAATNEAWHGGDIVPQRLQDVPNKEQYDETTDRFSVWLGDKLGISPYKINYVLDQYSGVIGDVGLPFLTPEAESGSDSVVGKLISPLADKFVTDAVMKNRSQGEFYDTMNELAINANSVNATDEDLLKSKYINSVNTDISKLSAEKRRIQGSDLPDGEKVKQVKNIQKQINAMSKEVLSEKDKVSLFGNYAEVSNRQYYLNNNGEWSNVNEKQKEKQDKVTEKLGISPSEYWAKKDMYDDAYDKPEKYAVSKVFHFDYATYAQYLKVIDNVEGDKNKSGNTISGSAKKNVIAHIESLPLTKNEKIILFKYKYPKDDKYNREIIQYMRERTDIAYADRVSILEALGFKVEDGVVRW